MSVDGVREEQVNAAIKWVDKGKGEAVINGEEFRIIDGEQGSVVSGIRMLGLSSQLLMGLDWA